MEDTARHKILGMVCHHLLVDGLMDQGVDSVGGQHDIQPLVHQIYRDLSVSNFTNLAGRNAV
jgi:hypothetical protein